MKGEKFTRDRLAKEWLKQVAVYLIGSLFMWFCAVRAAPVEYLWLVKLFFAATMTQVLWSNVLQTTHRMDSIEYSEWAMAEQLKKQKEFVIKQSEKIC